MSPGYWWLCATGAGLQLEPAPDQLTADQKSHILGAQANLWTEYIREEEHVEYMTLPRLAAMSEVQWMQPAKKEYAAFLERLPRLLSLYDKMGYNYATHVFDIKAELTPNLTPTLDVTFSTIDDAPVYTHSTAVTPASRHPDTRASSPSVRSAN